MLDKLDFNKIREKWLEKWEKDKVHEFKPAKGKPVYVIDSPPPFPTGEFHMGNVLNWCYFDFAARFKRMSGFSVLFPQGWDCHGFPTEVKVEKKHGRLPREQFREKCLEWTRDVISTIRPQMKLMGYSMDWKREYFTLDDSYKRTVQYSLLKNFDDGLIYRAEHPVLWCVHCESAIAKAETEDIERETALNFIKFSLEKSGKEVLIATTRPELLHACVAVAVNPADARFKQIVGQKLKTPLFDRSVPVIADSAVDPAFGTGVVMICTFGDKQDVLWQKQHSLNPIKAIDEKGLLLNADAYTGMHLEKARPKILEDLANAGLLEKQESLVQTVKLHDRCKKPVELVSSTQWFVKIKGSEEKILKAARECSWFPPFALQLFEDWLNGLEWDWCFSRQRVFGIPIPFYYCKNCDKVYAPKESELPIDPSKNEFHSKKCSCGGEIAGETSVCDGWVDSSVTPLIISKWEEKPELFKRLYPVSLRPQGSDIIRTWAFYTIFRCNALTGKPPFKEMLINGMVCGSDGKKMSKSAGNYVEAKEVVLKSSVDALRQWIALSGTTGKDNIFYWKDVTYAQSFLTKLWNASSFVQKSIENFDSSDAKQPRLRVADKWLLSKLQKLVKNCTASLDSYDYYPAITEIYSFFWHDFCDFYLEDVKYRIYGSDTESKKAAQSVLRKTLLTTLHLLAPFACYTTEELFHSIFAEEAKKAKSIHLSEWPKAEDGKIDANSEEIAGVLHSVISQIRKFKASNKLALNEEIDSADVFIPENLLSRFSEIDEEIRYVGKIREVSLKALPSDEKEAKVILKV